MAEETDKTVENEAQEAAVAEMAANMFGDETDLNLEAVYDVPVEITVVLGKKPMSISDLLKMGPGSVVELERKVGEAVDVFVNERLVARGEVVIVEDRIGITMTEIIKAEKTG